MSHRFPQHDESTTPMDIDEPDKRRTSFTDSAYGRSISPMRSSMPVTSSLARSTASNQTSSKESFALQTLPTSNYHGWDHVPQPGDVLWAYADLTRMEQLLIHPALVLTVFEEGVMAVPIVSDKRFPKFQGEQWPRKVDIDNPVKHDDHKKHQADLPALVVELDPIFNRTVREMGLKNRSLLLCGQFQFLGRGRIAGKLGRLNLVFQTRKYEDQEMTKKQALAHAKMVAYLKAMLKHAFETITTSDLGKLQKELMSRSLWNVMDHRIQTPTSWQQQCLQLKPNFLWGAYFERPGGRSSTMSFPVDVEVQDDKKETKGVLIASVGVINRDYPTTTARLQVQLKPEQMNEILARIRCLVFNNPPVNGTTVSSFSIQIECKVLRIK